MALTLLPVLLVATFGVLGPPASAESVTYEELVFTTHAGPGKHPKKESKKFNLGKPKIKWFKGGKVKYEIVNAPKGGAKAVKRAVETIDGFVTSRNFKKGKGSNNPCTDQPNSVKWVTGDGPGGALAFALVCYETKKHKGEKFRRIAGFRILIDELDPWATNGAADKLDIENVIAHEMGHVAGVDHVNKAKHGCLTMYQFSGLGETQKRTLGHGDKRGMDKLYDTDDNGPGPGCGL